MPTDMIPLVTLNGNTPVTTSLAIAKGVGVEHASVMKLIRTYLADLEQFGIVRFEIDKLSDGAGRPTEYAILNERQATLVLSYMRNSEVIRQFKIRLIKTFYEMAEQLQGLPKPSIESMTALGCVAKSYLSVAMEMVDALGVKKDVATVMALNQVEADLGISMAGFRSLIPGQVEPVETLNATKLGELVGISARQTNLLLEALGFQTKTAGSNQWELTEKGMQYGAAYPYERNGHTGHQIRWRADIASLLVSKH